MARRVAFLYLVSNVMVADRAHRQNAITLKFILEMVQPSIDTVILLMTMIAGSSLRSAVVLGLVVVMVMVLVAVWPAHTGSAAWAATCTDTAVVG